MNACDIRHLKNKHFKDTIATCELSNFKIVGNFKNFNSKKINNYDSVINFIFEY